MKGKRKMTGWIILLVVLLMLGIFGGKGWAKLSREHEEARNLPLDGVDFDHLIDGVYVGEYEGGMYKWRKNSVRVTVSDGDVTMIEPLDGVVDQKQKGDITMMYDRVIDSQSLQVDTINGATLTSNAYLKAIEIALLTAQN
ncbi:MAG: FMN-binding protein [Anaerolineaceae bacterium]|nr:FMN-binding protein [Anaerolineaceae bacterium]